MCVHKIESSQFSAYPLRDLYIAIYSCSSYISLLLINIYKKKSDKITKIWINNQQAQHCHSWSSAVGTQTRLWAGRSGIRIPLQEEIFLFSKKSKTALGQPSLLFSAHLGSFPGENSEGVKLTTDFHLVPRLRVSGDTTLLTLHAFIACTGIILPFTSPCFNSSSYAQDFLNNDWRDIFESFKIMNAIGPTLTPGTSSYMTPKYLAMSRICF